MSAYPGGTGEGKSPGDVHSREDAQHEDSAGADGTDAVCVGGRRMKSIKKYAELVGYTIINGKKMNNWRCPNKNCGMGVSEDYAHCPYCGQKIKFREPSKVKMFEIKMKVGGLHE